MVETSIIIRAKNEGRDIGRVLDRISEQNYKNYEVIVVDSGSTDNTLGIVRKRNIKVIGIEGRSYRPGKAMNIGAEAAKGKYILYLSAHAEPLSSDWLGNLIRNFNSEKVAACYGRQVPGPDCDPYQKLFFYGIFTDQKRIQTTTPLFSAVNGAIRKDLWQKLMFNERIPLREDSMWSKAMIKKGYSIIYEPAAVVRHAHHESYQKVFAKAYRTYYSLGSADADFKFSLSKELKDFLSAQKRALLMLFSGEISFAWLIRIIIFWLCRTIGFFLGYKRAINEKNV